MQSFQSALGVAAIVAIAFIVSENRRAVPWRSVIIGLILTFALALLMLKIPQAEIVFGWINGAIEAVAAATKAGTAFVFGYIGGGALPFDPKTPGSDFILAFQALPVVLVMSVLSSLLFYWRILPPIVRGFSWALERTLDVGGAAGLSTAANIFFGQVEAPLFIRPYLAKLSRSEMFIVMTGGMAGIAGRRSSPTPSPTPQATSRSVPCSARRRRSSSACSWCPTPNVSTLAAGSTTSSRPPAARWTPLCKERALGLSFFSISSPC
jgi:concentrative nucleoside transporter, CNT family